MKKKDYYSIFFKISLPIVIVAMLICYFVKNDKELAITIGMVYVAIIYIMLFLTFVFIEPKQRFDSISNNIKEDKFDLGFESLINDMENDFKLKELYNVRKLLSPLIIIPGSIFLCNITRYFIYEKYNDFFQNYHAADIDENVTIFCVGLSIFSIFYYLYKSQQIDKYIKKYIFSYYANKYKLSEINNDDELIKRNVNSYINAVDFQNCICNISNTYKVELKEKRIFTASIYYNYHRSRYYIFDGIEIIIPSRKSNIFYNTATNYEEERRFYRYFNICVNGSLKSKLNEIKNKYAKDFKIITMDDNIQLLSNQTLSTRGSFSKMKLNVIDYCKAIECLFEVAKAIEEDF